MNNIIECPNFAVKYIKCVDCLEWLNPVKYANGETICIKCSINNKIEYTKSGIKIVRIEKPNTDPTKKVCNCCIFNKLKPLKDFDEGKKVCRSCLTKRKVKFNCPCGGKYTVGGKSGHLKTKIHREYANDEDCFEFGFE